MPLHPPTSTAQGNESRLCLMSKDRTEQSRNKQVHPYCVFPSPTYHGPAPQAPGRSSSCFVLSGCLWHRHSQRLSVFFSSALWMCSPTTPGQGWGAPTSLAASWAQTYSVTDGPSQASPPSAVSRFPFRTTSSLPASLQFSGVEIHFHGVAAPNLKVKVLSVRTPGAEQHDPDPLHSHQTGLWVWISLASGPSSPTDWPTFTPGSASFQNQIRRPALSCSRSWDPSLQNSSLLLGLPNPSLAHISISSSSPSLQPHRVTPGLIKLFNSISSHPPKT